MGDRLTVLALRNAIADELADAYKDYEIEAACTGLGIPEVADAWTYNSKRVYVRNRLAGVRLPEMTEIAERIIEDVGAENLERLLRGTGVRGVDGELRNLIFAADGPKPRIVLADAINNVIDIVEGAGRCLMYDRPLPNTGLLWGELIDWWRTTHDSESEPPEASRRLYDRLYRSLSSDPERLLLSTYRERYPGSEGRVPALIPQVYLHYDPYTARELKTVDGHVLARQRMDFLLLLSERRRVVIEVDGQHHYSADGKPSSRLYSDMVAEDRRIRLAGYEVYRFGGWELMQPDAPDMLRAFFDELLA